VIIVISPQDARPAAIDVCLQPHAPSVLWRFTEISHLFASCFTTIGLRAHGVQPCRAIARL
jgi:hypothetical protein